MTPAARGRSGAHLAARVGIATSLILGALVFGLLLPLDPAEAAPQSGTASSLLRLPEVGVRVEPLTPSLEETGVTRTRLDSLAVARLGASGVPLRAAGGAESAVGSDGLLTVQATYLIHSGWHIVSLSLYFARSATLNASPETGVTSTVWSRGGVVVAKKKKLSIEVGTTFSELLDEFAQDYRIANPR